MKPKVYLAGPIDGCTYEETHGWRDDLVNKFSFAIDFVDPCRRISKKPTDREIVIMDKADINVCDALLANYWKNGTGTAMEIPYAYERGKVVVVVVPIHKHVSAWIKYHCHYYTHDLNQALNWLNEYYNTLYSSTYNPILRELDRVV